MNEALAITFDPLVPVWAIVPAGLAAIALAAGLTWRAQHVGLLWRGLALILRALAIAAIVLLLLGPARPDARAEPGSSNGPILDVLVDTSASMGREASADADGQTRLGHLRSRWLTSESLNRLRAVGRVRLHAFDRDVEPLEEAGTLSAEGNATRLGQAVERAIEGSPSAVLILSDGAATDVNLPEALAALGRRARARGVRFFAAAAGSADAPANTSCYAYATPGRVFEGERVALNAIVQRTRAVDVDRVELTVRADGEPVERVYLPFDPGERVRRVVVTHEPNRGPARQIAYDLAVHPVGDDADASDNAHRVMVDYLGRRIGVVLVEGSPHWDTRFMIDALAGDPRVDLTVAQAMSDQLRRVARDAPRDSDAAPPDLEALGEPNALGGYDVVILGRDVQRVLPGASAERLGRFVTRGGGLMFARGRAFGAEVDADGAIEALSPVRWGERFVEPLALRAADSSDGPIDARSMLADEQVAMRLPHMTGATRSQGLKTGAVVHMHQQPVRARGGRAPRQAALVGHRVGEGRVLAVLTEGLWRWAMLPPRLDEYRAVYRSLIGSSVRYLAGGDDLLGEAGVWLHADPVNAELGESVTVTLRTAYRPAASVLGANARVSVIDSRGERHSVELTPDPSDPRRAVGVYPPQAGGEHVVRFSAPGGLNARTRLYVSQTSAEAQHLAARPDLLRALVEASGGTLLEGTDAEPLLAQLRRARPPRASDAPQDARPIPATWLVAALVGLFAAEWFIRRGVGLR